MKKVIFSLLSAAVLTGCITVEKTHLPNNGDPKRVPILMTKVPEGNYVELKYLEAHGSIFHTSTRLLNRIAREAATLGANGLINARVEYQGLWPVATGVAVKIEKKQD